MRDKLRWSSITTLRLSTDGSKTRYIQVLPALGYITAISRSEFVFIALWRKDGRSGAKEL